MNQPNPETSSDALIRISRLHKRFDNDHVALGEVDLEIFDGEILALLGPNGAGKTTLISTICGIVTPTSGEVLIDGYNIISDYRKTRAMIGLVPQEIHLEPFTTVWKTVNFSRELFGKPSDPDYIESLLKDLTLWEQKDKMVMTLSGGMKRRLMIAKALSHQPRILFLDEPTAGVDVELRQGMWKMVDRLRQSGVTIILTTHYIEEAEESADRVAVINKGEILLVEDKDTLMRKLGKKTLVLHLKSPLQSIPEALIGFRDLDTRENSLEEIFVDLVRRES